MVQQMSDVLFHFRAAPEIGAGHAMRCTTLARALEAVGWIARFAISDATRRAAGRMVEGADCMIVAGDTGACVAETIEPGRSVVVVDSYAFDEADEAALYDGGARAVCVIDDLATRRHRCDMLLDQNMGRAAEDYDGLVPDHCVRLVGVEFALLRDEFASLRPRSESSAGGPRRRIFGTFGALDDADASSFLLRALDRIDDRELTIDLVFADAAPHREAVQAAARHSRHRVEVHIDPPGIAELMAAADLAVGSGGGTAWERCALGLPTVLVVVADNQMPPARALAEAGAVRLLGRLETQPLPAPFETCSTTPRPWPRCRKAPRGYAMAGAPSGWHAP
jgi:UDP-2,4-diacetamido-2,4,6-trideoxy-beta-L-altropyranose hydrolase